MVKRSGNTPIPKRPPTGGSARQRSARAGQPMTAGLATGSPLPPGVLGKTTLKRAGGSLVVTVPAAARNLLRLTEGQDLSVTVEGNRVIMEPMSTAPVPVRRPKYTLDELLAYANPEAPMTEDERAWQDAAAVGREIW